MLVGFYDVLIAQERRRDLLKEAEAHRTRVSQFGSRRPLAAGRFDSVFLQALHWLGSQFVSVGEVMQRRYVS